MSEGGSNHEELELEIHRLELETKRLELELKHQELCSQRESKRRIAISPVWIPLVAALCALFGSLGTTFVTARDRAQAEAIEQRKFELGVVEEAFKAGDPKKAAVTLLVAGHAGYIRLDDQQRERLRAVARGELSVSGAISEVTQPEPGVPKHRAQERARRAGSVALRP